MAQRKKIQKCKSCGNKAAHYDEGESGWTCQLCGHNTPIKRRKSKMQKAIEAWETSGKIEDYLKAMSNG